MKLALFTSTYTKQPAALEPWADNSSVYTRLSEYVEVDFPPRPAKEYVPEAVAAIDREIADLTQKFADDMNALKDQKANLLAITDEREDAHVNV